METLAEVPAVPVLSLRTDALWFPVSERVKVFSRPPETPWPFELQLEGAPDEAETIDMRGLLASEADLRRTPAGFANIGDGAAQGQGGSSRWREWAYEGADEPWPQRLFAVALASMRHLDQRVHLALTAQTHADRADQLFGFAECLARSLRALG
ncbi:MAG: hypothetical protein INH41_05550 [Myxococcaceae bacterium]|nr:hypothetical protein [Myxococcaceae bacterium]